MNYSKIMFLTIFIFVFSFSCDVKEKSEKKYLNYMKHKIYYEVRGKSLKTLVFIHGWTGSTQSWKYQLDVFNDYKIIAIDLPGNGKSSKNEKSMYSMELFADSINKVLKKEKIDKAFFIGHSMGFAICEIITQKYPDICAGICSIDGAHFELPEDPKDKKKWIQNNRDFAKSLETESGREFFINMLFLPNTPKILKDEVFKISKNVPLKIAKSMIDAAEIDQKYWIYSKKIDIPCLAIYSPVYHLPPDYKNVLQKIYPRIEYYFIPDVSHFFMMEVPYKVNQIIYDFLIKNY